MKVVRTIPYRRKREGKTNYKKRLKTLLCGKPRLVIRKSLNNIVLQVIEFQPVGDKILASSSSVELKKLGWNYKRNNLPAAYLTGMLLGKRAAKNKVKNAVLDIGLQTSVNGSKIYAALKGALDTGLDVPHSDKCLPSEDRIKGKHIADYSKNAKSSQFSLYSKNNASPADIIKAFEDVKDKIKGM